MAKRASSQGAVTAQTASEREPTMKDFRAFLGWLWDFSKAKDEALLELARQTSPDSPLPKLRTLVMLFLDSSKYKPCLRKLGEINRFGSYMLNIEKPIWRLPKRRKCSRSAQTTNGGCCSP